MICINSCYNEKRNLGNSCFAFFATAFVSFKATQQFEPIAVIELFTSQGCSSCPSADRLLSQTITDAKKSGKRIFALSYHVDYWNRLGWADPFSDKKYSERQSMYASAMNLRSIYTPQMIVNGADEFVGSSGSELKNALNKSLNTKATANFKSLAVEEKENKLNVNYALDGEFEECKINFALVSLSETTIVKCGENGGRTLTNENVVRQFISTAANHNGVITFSASPVPSKNNLAVVAFVQRNNDWKIIGGAIVGIN